MTESPRKPGRFKVTLGQRLMLDHGTRIHERVAHLLDQGLKGTGWRMSAVERDLRREIQALGLPIEAGRLDLELEHRAGHRMVIDTKTVRGRAFRYLTGPRPAHVLQLQTYLLLREIPAGALLYLDREGQNAAKVFAVERNDLAVWHAAHEARRIADARVPPPPLALERDKRGRRKAPWPCRFCEFADVSCTGARSS